MYVYVLHKVLSMYVCMYVCMYVSCMDDCMWTLVYEFMFRRFKSVYTVCLYVCMYLCAVRVINIVRICNHLCVLYWDKSYYKCYNDMYVCMYAWLQEYHLMVGVEHFFIYNLARNQKMVKKIQLQLASFIADGTVWFTLSWYIHTYIHKYILEAT